MKSVFKWTGRILGGGFLALVVFIAGLALFEEIFYWEYKSRESEFNYRLEEKIAAGETEIPLRDLTDFEWDEVYFFGSEYTKADLEQTIGFEYGGYIPSIWCDPFEKSDLVLVKNKEAQIISLPQCRTETDCEFQRDGLGSKCDPEIYLHVVNTNHSGGANEARFTLKKKEK